MNGQVQSRSPKVRHREASTVHQHQQEIVKLVADLVNRRIRCGGDGALVSLCPLPKLGSHCRSDVLSGS